MKRFLSYLKFCLIPLFVISGCNESTTIATTKKEEVDIKSGIIFLAEEIAHFYASYDSCNFTEFLPESVFVYETSEVKQTLCMQAKIRSYYGLNTFTTIYRYSNNYTECSSILTTDNEELKNAEIYEKYYEYKEDCLHTIFLNIDACNNTLQSSLNGKFKKGMEGFKNPSYGSNLNYFGGDESLLYKNFDYEIENGEVSIIKHTSFEKGRIKVPETIDGYPVTRIKSGAFAPSGKRFRDPRPNPNEQGHIETVILPDSIKYIEQNAFDEKWSYGYVDYLLFPENVVDIPVDSYDIKGFYKGIAPNRLIYGGLSENDILIQNGLVFVKDRQSPYNEAIVADCLFSTEIADIPKYVMINGELLKVTTLGYGAFSFCSNLKKIYITEFLTKGLYAGIEMFDEWYLPNYEFVEYGGGLYLSTRDNPYYAYFRNASSYSSNIIFHKDMVKKLGDTYTPHSYYDEEHKIGYIPKDGNPHFFARAFNDSSTENIEVHPETVWLELDDEVRNKNIVISSNIEKISFEWYYQSNNFIVDENNPFYSSDIYGSLFSDNGKTLVQVGSKYTSETYIVPDDVLSIETYAFSGSSVHNVILSENTKELKSGVFSHSGVSNVYIGQGLETIENLGIDVDGNINITISPHNNKFKVENGMLLSSDRTRLYYLFNNINSNKVFVVPSTIVQIVASALPYTITNTSYLIIPNSVKYNFAYAQKYKHYTIICQEGILVNEIFHEYFISVINYDIRDDGLYVENENGINMVYAFN